MRAKTIGLLAGALLSAACSSTPAEPSHPPPPKADQPASTAAGPGAPLADAGDGGDAGDAAVVETPGQPAACPAEMALVDGEYCTELEMKCLKSWYATSNKKIICEVFQEPTTCTGQKEKRRYCIDRYEYPNKKGVRPEVMNNFYQAQVLCQKEDKRVCTETEWTMACEGPSYKPYPYGYIRDATKCRGDLPYGNPSKDKLWKRDPVELERLWQGVVSGSQPECVSDYGVYDMPGNADELAASEHYNDGKYDNVTTGGPWYKGVRNQCRPKIYTHDEGFQYYYLSFRCCKETDGKPTDPRSPKQIKRGQPWEKVAWLAEHSLDLRPNKERVIHDPASGD
jgi:formylglycine-generating enzyme